MKPLYSLHDVKQMLPSLGIKELELLQTTLLEDKAGYTVPELKALLRMLECRLKFIASFEAKVMSWYLTYLVVQRRDSAT